LAGKRSLNLRVLLVDDDAGITKSVELMLKSEGMYVDKTVFGEEGVDLGKLYDYDVILLDLTLPDEPLAKRLTNSVQ
jgi:two-component system, cell cycle response regulator CtrA